MLATARLEERFAASRSCGRQAERVGRCLEEVRAIYAERVWSWGPPSHDKQEVPQQLRYLGNSRVRVLSSW